MFKRKLNANRNITIRIIGYKGF